MLDTRLARSLGLAVPIVNAGMAMVARPALAAAVSNAGGLGTIACDINPPEVLRTHVRETRALTPRPFGVDLIGDFLTEAHLQVLVEEAVAVAIFFWTFPTAAQVRRLQEAGVRVWMQVGSVAEAAEAVDLGAEALIVQGAEAGGHTRSEASTLTLFPRVRRRHPDLPLLAAGGIVDGRTMAAALVLGSDALWCGTRFLAAAESEAHDGYKAAVTAADVGDTMVSTLYGPEWPGQPMRVIAGATARAVEAGAPVPVRSAIGTTRLNGETVPLPPFSAILPTRDFEGDLAYACLTAGQSAGNVHHVLPAGEIVREMAEEAIAALKLVLPIVGGPSAVVVKDRNEAVPAML
jgi:NAD(P)H-dependent flavin oxidoreductase YrpB (nitropropane dioxygenase family)